LWNASLRSLLEVTAAIVLATTIGVLIGTLAAVSRRPFLRLFCDAAVTLTFSTPMLLVLLLVLGMVGDRPAVFPSVAGMFAWGGIALATQSAIRETMQRAFSRAAVALGASPAYILRWHILPNVLPEIRASVVGTLPVLFQLSVLISFIGVGGGNASLGSLIRQGYELYPDCWWLWIPATVVAVTLLAIAAGAADKTKRGQRYG
jgi:ABC-type dipeptide/oligopeptide/nickel transport system permease subunit